MAGRLFALFKTNRLPSPPRKMPISKFGQVQSAQLLAKIFGGRDSFGSDQN
jgi:hypothetical protein